MGIRWCCIFDGAASSASVPALKQKPALKSTLAAWDPNALAQRHGIEDRPDGPPPLCPSLKPASAAFRKLLGLYCMFLALR